jgi:uncharacterized surface protein with fasciclin (FAS1) repeats
MYEDETFIAYDELPISLYLKGQPDFSQWVELLEHAEMFNTLNINSVYTAFVPTNEAMVRYLSKMGYSTVKDIPKEDAVYLVKYHTIHGLSVDLSQFQSGAIDKPNETKDNLTVDFRDGGLSAVYLNDEARILKFDIKATNGIIHTLEDVLIPLTATIIDRLKEDKYSIFYKAVEATGYVEMLNTINTSGVDAEGNPIEIQYRYTTFAVSNGSYANAGINSFEELLTKLNVGDSQFTSPDNPLYQYVSYHLLSQLRSYADLADFPAGTNTKNVPTLAENELISFTGVNGELVINYNENATSVRLVASNIPCKNGVIHEVDHWMPVFTPPSVSIIWELTDYPDLEANVSQFQNASLGSQYNKTFSDGELTSYRWMAQPETRTGVISYRNNRAADGIWYSKVLNHDHLRVELGEFGWIEMDSPVIIKGKYRITFVWPSPKQASNTGVCGFMIDGQEIRPRHTISNTKEDRTLEQVLGTVTFDETTSHTLRIISLDGKLITMDYIRFDPID